MMLATSKHVFKIKTCRNLFKNYNNKTFVSRKFHVNMVTNKCDTS